MSVYEVELVGDLDEEIKDLARVHTNGNVPLFLKRLALQAASPEAHAALCFELTCIEDDEVQNGA